MGQINTGNITTFVTGTIILASPMNTNFNEIVTVYNTHDTDTSGIHGVTGAIVGTTDSQTLTDKTMGSGTAGAVAPVGTIVGHYDFNATVSVDTNYWVYCDGSAISNASSPIDGETTPDLSNRYLVGFGTEGGGDIDTAAWATAAVGNASHQIDIEHNHQWFDGNTNPSRSYNSSGSVTNITGFEVDYGSNDYTLDCRNNSDDYYTDNALSTTQSVQPRSIRVRWIMRVV